MKSMQRLIIISGLSLFNGMAIAGSVAGFGGSTEITQILNNVELVNQSALIYQQIQQTLQQVLMEKQQLQNLIASPIQNWGQAQQDLAALADLVAKTGALTYAGGNIDQLFKQKFPGYARTTGTSNFGAKYQGLVQSQLDSLNSALQVAGLQSSQFVNEVLLESVASLPAQFERSAAPAWKPPVTPSRALAVLLQAVEAWWEGSEPIRRVSMRQTPLAQFLPLLFLVTNRQRRH